MENLSKNISPEEIRKRLDDILPHVTKPGRYFAGEIGIIKKKWDSSRVRVVIAFPDVYEIATVNLGHRLIHHIINSRDDYLSERVYSTWPDMEDKLRETETPLYSLESFRPIREFDILGISITHELNYTNVLQIIDLSGLPLRAADRGFPIVIAGGTAVFNPEPISPFIDAFLLGDGEETVQRLLDEIEKRRGKIDKARGDIQSEKRIKNEILDVWGGAGNQNGVQGIYIPSHFDVLHSPDGRIEKIINIAGGADVVRKAVITNLDDAPWVLDPPISHMQKLASRVTVEPVRGCTHGCRFCQAGMVYRPYRERSLKTLLNQAEALLDATGLQEQSFLALTVTDWPYLQDFIKRMQEKERNFHLKISLPSGRIAALNRELTDLVVTNRKGGLTLAVEAATPRLRAVINKETTYDDIELAIKNAVSSNWDLIKLYFMIGLPTETDDDVAEIIHVVERIKEVHRKLKKEGGTKVGRLKLKVSVSNFVPKAHTPFQWAAMDFPEILDRKQKLLTGLRKLKGVEFKFHEISASWIEGIMARGDRRLANAVEKAYELGARFDAWGDQCKVEIWEKAFEITGINPDDYLRERDLDEVLPWDHLSCGVDKDWLRKDWLRSLDEKMIPDCNETVCVKCGVQDVYPDCRPVRIDN